MALLLVVDDEPDVRLVARVVLTAAGHEVIEADGGAAALAALDGNRTPDLVLLDVKMPDIDGWEVLRRLRANPSHPAVPVVVFTAHLSARSDAPEGWRDFEHFLVKPFKPDDLLAAVERALV